MKEEIVRLERVTKIVDGVTLLDNFNLHIFMGEVMGLVCINSHGRTVLIELLCQNLPIHYGHIYFKEVLVNNYEHSSMNMNRVAVIEKQSRLVEDLSVMDNIFVLRRGFKKHIIDSKMLISQFRKFAEELDIYIGGEELVRNLSYFEKCVVELLKAVVAGMKLVVFQDISNFISATDLKKIHEIIHYYSKQGISFLYICNHLEEAYKICNRISIMENGKVIKVLNKKDYREDRINPYTLDFNHADSPSHSDVSKNGILKFQNVFTENIRNISLTIEKGECVVLLDMDNTVLTDIIKLMNREIVPLSGGILLDGYYFSNKSCKLKNNICFIQENPINTMLFQELNYIDNLCFLVYEKQHNFWLKERIKKSIIQEYKSLIGEDIYEENITDLSPNSLYNLIYYRIHLFNPGIVFCIQPFSGADMYLRQHLVELINKLKEKRITIIILAVNLSDSLAVADRLMVIKEGQLSREYHSDEFHFFNSM